MPNLHAILYFRRVQARASGDNREVAVQAFALAKGQVHISSPRLLVIGGRCLFGAGPTFSKGCVCDHAPPLLS